MLRILIRPYDMLTEKFKKENDYVYHASELFNREVRTEWFSDELVQKMLCDIDRVEVIDGRILRSPYGLMPPHVLSNGVKTLILLLKQPHRLYRVSIGDNCSKWIVEIGKRQDIRISMYHVPKFDMDFDAVIENTGQVVHTLDEFFETKLDLLCEIDEEEENEDYTEEE